MQCLSCACPSTVVDFDIKSRVQDDILIVTLSGRVTDSNVHDFVKRYLELVSTSSLKKTLVDARPLEQRLSLGSAYFLVQNLPRPLPPGVKTAYVEDEKFREMAEFVQVALANVSVEVRLFLSYDEALAWLRSL